jgi:hypothetical protein
MASNAGLGKALMHQAQIVTIARVPMERKPKNSLSNISDNVRRQMALLLLIAMVITSHAVYADPEGYVDGHDWVRFTADYKLALVQATQEKLREQSMTTERSAEFYLVALNDFYSDPHHVKVSFAEALSIIGFPLGDFEAVEPEHTDEEEAAPPSA